MTWEEYKKMTLKEMQTKRWRTAEIVRTGVVNIPKGVEVQVISKGGGLTISGPRCKHCKVSIYARKCNPYSVEEIR